MSLDPSALWSKTHPTVALKKSTGQRLKPGPIAIPFKKALKTLSGCERCEKISTKGFERLASLVKRFCVADF